MPKSQPAGYWKRYRAFFDRVETWRDRLASCLTRFLGLALVAAGVVVAVRVFEVLKTGGEDLVPLGLGAVIFLVFGLVLLFARLQR